jgi:hypothetical protein
VQRTVFTTLLFVVLSAPRLAFASDAPAEDEEDLGGLEEEAFGTRGLVRTRAESVAFDAKERSLELSGNVRVDAPPFHLRSQHVKLARTKYGIEADGNGKLAFCPCLGTPVTIEFSKAIVAPPGELILKDPKLEIYGVPVAYLPWFWLRSDEKVGVLPPDLAYRGGDGFFAGEGVHLPWKDRGSRHALDLRGGAYLEGGFVTDVRLRDPTATAKIRFDRLPGSSAPVLSNDASADRNADNGLLVDARGATRGDRTTVAWDADVLRGRRGVAATTDLDSAAKPWDRASASGALALGPIIAESGFRAVTRRGGDLATIDAFGPFAALRTSGAASSNVTYDATVEGGALRLYSFDPQTVSYARAEVGALAATTFGPIASSLAVRGAGNVTSEAQRTGSDRAGTARLRFGVPVARAFDNAENDPLVHVLEPFAEATVLHASGDAILGTLPGRGLAAVTGTAPVTSVGFTSTLGRWARRDAFDVTAAYGATYSDPTPQSLGRVRAGVTTGWLGGSIETGHVIANGDARGGSAVVGRLRFGRSEGLRLLTNVASRSGIDPILARALTDASLESPAGFLSRSGTTGGASLVVPWAHAVATSLGADGDATTQELVAARAGVELRDRCGCITLHANGSHRIGREGVDVWIALDFAADR